MGLECLYLLQSMDCISSCMCSVLDRSQSSLHFWGSIFDLIFVAPEAVNISLQGVSFGHQGCFAKMLWPSYLIRAHHSRLRGFSRLWRVSLPHRVTWDFCATSQYTRGTTKGHKRYRAPSSKDVSFKKNLQQGFWSTMDFLKGGKITALKVAHWCLLTL